MGQDFINAAAGLNRAGNRQVAVFLQQQIASNGLTKGFSSRAFIAGMATSSDSIIRRWRFRKGFRQIGRKTIEAGVGILNVFCRQANVG